MTLRRRRRDGGLRLSSGRFGPRFSSGRHCGSSTCRVRAPLVRRYISRRREEATADLRCTVALSPPGAALRHFRTRAKNPPERTSGGGVASPSLGTVFIGRRLRRRHRRRRRWPPTIGHVILEGRIHDARRRDAAPGTRSDFHRRANSDIDCAAQSSRLICITCPGREEDEVRTASSFLDERRRLPLLSFSPFRHRHRGRAQQRELVSKRLLQSVRTSFDRCHRVTLFRVVSRASELRRALRATVSETWCCVTLLVSATGQGGQEDEIFNCGARNGAG